MSSGTIQQANKVLSFLKQDDFVATKDEDHTPFRWIQTGPLLARSGLYTEMDHKEFRKMMLRLASGGLVRKVGTGSFRWSLAVDKWDETNPFGKKTAPNYKPVEPAKQSFQPKTTVDNTFNQTALNALSQGLLEAHRKITEQAGMISSLKSELKEVRETANSHVKHIEVKKYDSKSLKLKNVILPKVFDRVLALAKCRRNILLVGPAGCGKTHLAEMIAKVLELEYSSMSCTSGISESHLLGKSVPNLMKGKNIFQGTAFLSRFEEGGVGLLDELDAADSNLMLSINTGLANNYMNVPNRHDNPRAIRHPDFICIATANTFGRGANRQYVGRNQLDEATLDRFRIGIVEMDYDTGVELAICPDIGGEKDKTWNAPIDANGSLSVQRLLALGYNLRQTCQYVRYKINQTGIRRIMSTRFMQDAYVMMKEGGWDLKTILEVFFEGWTDEEKAKVM